MSEIETVRTVAPTPIPTMKATDMIPWETTGEIGVAINHHVTESGRVYQEIIGHTKGYSMWRAESDPDKMFMFVMEDGKGEGGL